MAKINNNHHLGEKIDRIIYLLESLLAVELNKTNLDRNEIRAHLGIDKARVNKMLDGIERNNPNKVKAPQKAKVKSKNKK